MRKQAWGKEIQAEGTAGAKALRPEQVCMFQDWKEGRPWWLGHIGPGEPC